MNCARLGKDVSLTNYGKSSAASRIGKAPLHARPKWWGKLVIELIYDTLDPDVAEWLKTNKPPPGRRWHQPYRELRREKLVSRCYEIIGMGKTCTTIRELREKVAHHYGKEPMQLTMYPSRQGHQ